jgi:hypothetical protein
MKPPEYAGFGESLGLACGALFELELYNKLRKALDITEMAHFSPQHLVYTPRNGDTTHVNLRLLLWLLDFEDEEPRVSSELQTGIAR